jgi:hypothetical protein
MSNSPIGMRGANRRPRSPPRRKIYPLVYQTTVRALGATQLRDRAIGARSTSWARREPDNDALHGHGRSSTTSTVPPLSQKSTGFLLARTP